MGLLRSGFRPSFGYLVGIALSMVLVGVGQGLTLAPLTGAGLVGVAPEDAGAASELVNAAHQLSGSLGLGLLVALAVALRLRATAPSAAKPARRLSS